jgi:hypothetical protein
MSSRRDFREFPGFRRPLRSRTVAHPSAQASCILSLWAGWSGCGRLALRGSLVVEPGESVSDRDCPDVRPAGLPPVL